MSSHTTNGYVAATENQEVDLIRLLGVMIDHRLLILCITFLFTAIAGLYACVATPIYKADAMVQIEGKQDNSLLKNLGELNPELSPDALPEIQLLKSRMILGKTVDDLHLNYDVKNYYFPMFGRIWGRMTGRKPATLSLINLHIPAVKGKAQSLTLTIQDSKNYRIEGDDFQGEGVVGEFFEKNGVSLWVNSMVGPSGTRFILNEQSKLESINVLNNRFAVVETAKQSGVLNLSLTGPDPDLIARSLDSITENYLRQNIDRQAAQDAKSLAFLQRELPQIRADLDLAEERLNSYRKQRDSVDLTLEAKSVLEQIVNADNQLNELTFREAEISQLFKKDHPTYRALNEKRQTLENEKARLNMRKGYVHQIFSLTNRCGLADVLMGKGGYQDAIQHYAPGGVDVLTCGQAPTNPSELLIGDHFQQLLKWANEHYEMVIVDTPPILAVTDASLVGRRSGTTLLVARFGMTSVKEMQACVKRLHLAGVSIDGAILNDVVKSAAIYYTAGYSSYEYRQAAEK